MNRKVFKMAAAVMASLMVAGAYLPSVDVLASETSEGYFLDIGSVSKVYVTTAAMQLVDQGLIDLDSPVTDYIPEFTMADERYHDITVRMLMNHTSGLMGSVYSESFSFGYSSPGYNDRVLEILKTSRLKADPGSYYCYCNDGFTLLEIIIERVSGMSYTDYCLTNICEPLGLTSTGTMYSVDEMGRQIPVYMNGARLAPECCRILGSGGILSTSEEVAIFGSSFYFGNEILLSDEAKAEMGRYYGGLEGSGLGWDIVSLEDYENAGVTVWIKGGDTFLQHASLVVAPEEEISVAVLSSGGSSTIDQDMALEIMDIALEERGIVVEHPEEEIPDVVDQVPSEYLQYEGLYCNSEGIIRISFPEGRYMLYESVTSEGGFEGQLMYTTEGDFVAMSGDVDSGNAIVASPLFTLSFEEYGDDVLVVQDGSSYALRKVDENIVSSDVQSAWDERSGSSYYLVSSPYNDIFYAVGYRTTLTTSADAPGYVNGYTIIDSNTAMNMVGIPGIASRDISDIEITAVDGHEYLTSVDQGFTYIREDAIPLFTSDITSVPLTSGEASWYRIEDMHDVSITLDLPEDTACYVYDENGNVVYTNFMVDYGNTVPLPECGMIVFIGDTGSEVGIRR